MNPYAGMKAPQGGFDLRSADDGIPAANVRSGRGKAVLFASVLVGAVMAMSLQRLAKEKKDMLAYDPQQIADLAKIKLDPRPNTAKIFRVDYFRLPDADVDKLFNYYYDSIALYAEVERHIKKSNADAETLKAYTEKAAAAGTAEKHYGVVFDNSQGKLVVGNLVEIGRASCRERVFRVV